MTIERKTSSTPNMSRICTDYSFMILFDHPEGLSARKILGEIHHRTNREHKRLLENAVYTSLRRLTSEGVVEITDSQYYRKGRYINIYSLTQSAREAGMCAVNPDVVFSF